MKRVALVAAHFSPSNLAAIHRSRLWAQHLPEFGWDPLIVTTHWRYYEEKLDWDLHALVDPELRVIRTPALPTRLLRVVGDIGIRGLAFHYRALRKLALNHELDFIHITIPSNYSALLGRMVRARYGVPYGIDYIDPWVHHWPGSEAPLSKAWLSRHLANLLEPWAVRGASLITGVAPGYFEDVFMRNPGLRGRVVAAAMPYGGSEDDFKAIRAKPRAPFLFRPDDGRFHVIYAGAMLPQAYGVLERLLQALRVLRRERPQITSKLSLHFVGTGKSPDDPNGYNIRPLAERYEVTDMVHEHPQRIGYVDVLNHLIHASGVLVLGSTEPHYSPSKLFQAVLSGRPVFALLHEASTAVGMLRESGAGEAMTFTEASLPEPEVLAQKLARFIEAAMQPREIRWAAFEPYSARASARALAAALDEALARSRA